MPAAALAGTGNLTAAGAVTASLAVAKPANTANGDLLVAFVGHQNGTGVTETWGAPAGWTAAAVPNGLRSFEVFTKPITDAASEPGTYTFTCNQGTGRFAIVCFRVTGADLDAPVAAIALGAYQGTANSPITMGALSALAGQLLLGCLYTSMPGGSYPTPAYSALLTHLGYGGTANAGSTNTLMYASAGQVAADGGTGTLTAALTHINGEGALLAIRPLSDTTPPTVPVGTTATVDSPTQVTVDRGSSTDTVGVVSYRVQRDGVTIPGAEALTAQTYVDAGLAPETTFSYTVSAVDAAGNRSTESPAVEVTTPAAGINYPTTMLRAANGDTGRPVTLHAKTGDGRIVPPLPTN